MQYNVKTHSQGIRLTTLRTNEPTNQRKNEQTNKRRYTFLFTYTCCPIANTVEAAQ